MADDLQKRAEDFADLSIKFAAKLGIVSEEADESVFWLQRISNADIKSTVATSPLLSEAEELARIFCASARTARGRRGGRTD